MTPVDELDSVWKALADSTRRRILDLLRDGPRTTSEVVAACPHLSRFGVMKHLEVLRSVGLVVTRSEHRRKINTLELAPLRLVREQWLARFQPY